MCIKSMGWFALLAVAGVLGFVAEARASHLAAPENVTCEIVDEEIVVDWDDVEGAVKYSVEVVALYDTDGNGEPDEIAEFDFGTGDRTDGGLASDSDLTIPLADLTIGEDPDVFEPVAIMLRVKALDPGRGKGRQNHPFSEWCIVE
jgi:hypothetical protein